MVDDDPLVPDVPEVLDAPLDPDVPLVPLDPDVPEVPEVPDAPLAPEVPDVLEPVPDPLVELPAVPAPGVVGRSPTPEPLIGGVVFELPDVPLVEPEEPLVEPLPMLPAELPLLDDPPDPELPGGFWPPGAPFSQPLCLPGFCSRRSNPRLR